MYVTTNSADTKEPYNSLQNMKILVSC